MRSIIAMMIIVSAAFFASVMAQTTQPANPEKKSAEELIQQNRILQKEADELVQQRRILQMEVERLQDENKQLKRTITALTGDRHFRMPPNTPDPSNPLPKGWQERPFNEGSYYIVPLETPEAEEAAPAK